MRREYVFLILISLLTACAAEPTLEPFVAPTLEVTGTESSSFDREALQTQIFEPQETFPQIKISTRAVTPTPTLFENPRNDVSPDGKYVAVLVREYDSGSEKDEIQIIDRNEEIIQSVAFIWEGEGAPRPFIFRDHWSADSKYYYYGFFADGEGVLHLFDGRELNRLDVQTGEIVGMIDCDSSIAWGFSPDDTYLAYICYDDSPYSITLRELESGLEQSWATSLENALGLNIGAIRWSPDQTKLVFFASDYQLTSIYLLDLTNNELSVAVEDKEMELYGIYDWQDDDSIVLRVEGAGTGDWLKLNPITGNLEEIAEPTRTP